MADSYFNFENRLRALGIVENEEFTTAAGLPANVKIDLEKVIELDFQLAAEIAGILAVRLAVEKPDLLISVPDGANSWAQQVAMHMELETIIPKWFDKRAGKLRFSGSTDIEKVRKASRIALIDDVFTTGSSIEKVAAHPDIASKVVAAGVIWNRSSESPQLGFPVASVVNSYLPLVEHE